MCELLGLSTKYPTDVKQYLKNFYSHSVHHPHGWGLMRMNDGGTQIIKEPACASKSEILNQIIDKTQPQNVMLAHIRLATVGAAKYTNCHPYSGIDASGRQWTLIHNGTIYSGKQLSKYLAWQAGDTDSERIFLHLITNINAAVSENNAPLSAEQRFEIIDNLAVTLSPRNKLNLLIYDGELLYAHQNMMETLYQKQLSGGVLISTQPVDDDEWEPFPMTQLLAFRGGEKVFTGTKHNSAFVPTLEYITALDAMNI
jgi:glutamine amidotransferase